MQALVAVRKMNLLFPAVVEGSRGLVHGLAAKKSRTNKVLTTTTVVGASAGLFAAGFFFGPPALVAALYAAWISAGTTGAMALGAAGAAGTVGAGIGSAALLFRMPWTDGARWEKSEL